jgi:hypothetical protein
MILHSPTKWYNKIEAFFIGNNFSKEKNKITDQKSIFLIDEADVFFNEEFYGQCYQPAIKLKDPAIRQLLTLIW